MIAKSRKIPVHLQQLEALLRRLPESHPKREEIAEDIKKQKAGYKGEQAMKDYALLVGRTVTNKEMKLFLHISSHHIMKRLLLGMGFPYRGDTRDRVYELLFEE